MAKKERLDVLLLRRGLVESRERGQRLIMSGDVLVNDVPIDKASTKVPEDAELRVRGERLPYVSRGGLKLAEALARFPVEFNGAVVCDLGASTGGFVDCALQHGAARVYAVDVGYGQLAWSLRQDERVVNMEKTNARYLTAADFPERVAWVTTDVSFISLTKILPAAYALLAPEGQMIALIKPQFEAGRAHIGKNGVVRDPAVHRRVICEVMAFAETLGFQSAGLVPSPVRGPKGNVEYLYWMSKLPTPSSLPIDIEKTVEAGQALP